MFLPKPNAINLPQAASQLGTGLGACNSSNSCGSQKCDSKSGDSGGCGWTLACTLLTLGLAQYNFFDLKNIKGGDDMFLPKPNAISLPLAASQLGTGLGACNSNNTCTKQNCDVNNSSGGCGWSLAKTLATLGFA